MPPKRTPPLRGEQNDGDLMEAMLVDEDGLESDGHSAVEPPKASDKAVRPRDLASLRATRVKQRESASTDAAPSEAPSQSRVPAPIKQAGSWKERCMHDPHTDFIKPIVPIRDNLSDAEIR